MLSIGERVLQFSALASSSTFNLFPDLSWSSSINDTLSVKTWCFILQFGYSTSESNN